MAARKPQNKLKSTTIKSRITTSIQGALDKNYKLVVR